MCRGKKLRRLQEIPLTVNGYLGSDGILPLLDICDKQDKGIFVLVKTSNPSSGELQDLKLDSNESIYETMGHMCEAWGAEHMGKYGYSAVGAVVGATLSGTAERTARKIAAYIFLGTGIWCARRRC